MRRQSIAGALARALSLWLLAAGSACAPSVWAGGQPSAEALAREVWTAVSAGDEARLLQLGLDEAEFRRDVWPWLPAAQPQRNLPVSYVWGDLQQKSHQRRRETLARHRGRAYRVEAVRFTGASTPYGDTVVHRDSLVTVRDAAGARLEVRLFGSAIERGGQWKVFSYNVEE